MKIFCRGELAQAANFYLNEVILPMQCRELDAGDAKIRKINREIEAAYTAEGFSRIKQRAWKLFISPPPNAPA